MPARQSHQRVFMADNAGKLRTHTHGAHIHTEFGCATISKPFLRLFTFTFFLFIYLRFIIEQQHDMNFNECQQEHPRSDSGTVARLGAQLPLAAAAAHTHIIAIK